MTTKKMFGKLVTSKLMKVISIMVVACSLTGCGGSVSQQDARQTTSEYERENGNNEHEARDPNQDIDDGYWHDEEPSSTEEPDSTEEPSVPDNNTAENPPTGGMYTYDVDGIQIALRTNIDDYISVRASGAYQVNLLGIAESLGFEIMGVMADGTPYELRRIHNFYLIGDHNTTVWLTDEREQNFYEICATLPGGDTYIVFARYDVASDSVTTYWIDNSDELAPVNKINFEQIVIFTYLLENAAFAPYEDWAEESGLPTASGPSVFYVNK